MKFSTLAILFLIVSSNCQGQGFSSSISTTTTLGFSGLSQSLWYGLHKQDISVYLGPKVSLSRNRNLVSNAPGSSVQFEFHPDCKGKFFVLYEWLPQEVDSKFAHIHEAYAGYGYRWVFDSGFQINSGIGIGFYYESGDINIPYTLKSIAYCSNISLGYRF